MSRPREDDWNSGLPHPTRFIKYIAARARDEGEGAEAYIDGALAMLKKQIIEKIEEETSP